MAGGIIDSCDPVGRPKVVDAKASLKPEWRKLLVEGAQTEFKLVVAKLFRQRRHR